MTFHLKFNLNINAKDKMKIEIFIVFQKTQQRLANADIFIFSSIKI